MTNPILASRGNKRTITAAIAFVLPFLQLIPQVQPYMETILWVVGLFGGAAVTQAAASGTLVSPVDVDPRDLER